MAYRLLVCGASAVDAAELSLLVARLPQSAALAVEIAHDVASVHHALVEESADVLLLDVRVMMGSLDGISLVRACLPAGSRTQVVYVGDCCDFRGEVYETRHAWFVLRPIDDLELEHALGRALELRRAWSEEPLVVHTGGSERLVVPNEVSHVESVGHELRIHTQEGVVTTSAKKSDLLGLLPQRFVQCHRSHVVNLGLVDALGKDGLTLSTGEVVPVSRSMRTCVRTALERHADGRML